MIKKNRKQTQPRIIKRLLSYGIAAMLILTPVLPKTISAKTLVPSLTKSITMNQGKTKIVTIAAKGLNIKKIRWKTSNKKVATVTANGKLKGKIKALQKGSAKITAILSYYDGKKTVSKKLFCNVTIKSVKAKLKISKDGKRVIGISNKNNATYAVIPKGITSIDKWAFSFCDNLTSISIPDGVTSIGEYAFYSCDNLTSISIPDSVTSIGNYTFFRCEGLTTISIPNSVTSIGEVAFYGCASLTAISIPDGITSIADETFSGCTSLTTISIPNSVTSIGENAFFFCRSLTAISIPDSVTYIDKEAFSDCFKLTRISWNGRIYHKINDLYSVFYKCDENGMCLKAGILVYTDSTKMVGAKIIPNGVTSIGRKAFEGCNNLTSISIPNGVISIGDNAFGSCKSLTTISIPDGVTSIGNYTFFRCDSLTSISIPDSLTSISSYAFSWCSNLKAISLPDGLSSIGEEPFNGCDNLTSISWKGRIYNNINDFYSAFEKKYPL